MPRILGKLGADVRVVGADLDKALSRLPRAHGAALDVDASRGFKDVWEDAGKQAEKMRTSTSRPSTSCSRSPRCTRPPARR